MGVYASIITAIIGAGIKLYGASQSPNYPSPPKLNKLDVQGARNQMENYESRRMQASIDAWKARFPLLYQGGKYEIEDIAANQAGKLSPTIGQSLSNAGLEQPKGGNQYALSTDLGLSPITLAQRTSQAVNRQIALNPEWTNQISGGTLATMIANNYQNQNAFTQFLGANQTAQYVAGQQRSAFNTAALTSGLIGGAGMGVQLYQNQFGPLSPQGQGNAAAFSSPPAYPTSYGYAGGQGSYGAPTPYPSYGGGSYGAPASPPPSMYGNSYAPMNNMFYGQDLTQPPSSSGQFYLDNPYG